MFDSDYFIYNNSFCHYTGKEKKVVVPEGVTIISDRCFFGNDYIEEVILPESLQMIKGMAFAYCDNLRQIFIPKNVKRIIYDSFLCNNLEKFDVDKENPYFEAVDGCLYKKGGKKLISYPNFKEPFEDDIPAGTEEIGRMAISGCYLSSLFIPKTVKKINEGAFFLCTRMQNVELEKGIKNFSIKNNTLRDDKHRINLFYIPKTFMDFEEDVVLRSNGYRLGENSYNNVRWNSVELKGFEKIPAYAFMNSCLRKIKVSGACKTIEPYAFTGCELLEEVHLSKNITDLDDTAFDDCGEYEIYCPKNSEAESFAKQYGINYHLTEK